MVPTTQPAPAGGDRAGGVPRLATRAEIAAFERVPLEHRLSGLDSTYDVLAAAAARQPDAAALVFHPGPDPAAEPTSLSYAQLLARVTQAANLFLRLGVGPDDVVAYLLPNLPQTHCVLWGAQAAGVACAVNWMLAPEHVAAILTAVRAKVLVVAGPGCDGQVWATATRVRPLVPTLRAMLHVGAERRLPGSQPLDDLLDLEPGDRLRSARTIRPEDLAAYFHTGGTTGRPKIARHTHRNEVFDAAAVAWMNGLSTGDTVLVGLPLFHVNSVVMTGLASFFAGARAVLLTAGGYRDRGVLANFWRLVERYRADLFVAVPTVYARLLQHPVGAADISSLRHALCGAAPLPPALLAGFEAATGVSIVEGYGLTEGTAFCASNPVGGPRRAGSIGLSIPYQQLRVVRVGPDGRTDRDCGPGEVGTLAIRGPNVFPGYLHPADGDRLWVADGWLNTGDLASRDADGYVWLRGRAKDVIIRGGHNIDPGPIEDALASHPAVDLVAAVGKPDADAGELPVAYLTLRPGTAATAADLLAHARAGVPERAAAPAEVVILPAMPTTAVGKIFKPALRLDAAGRALAELAAAACGAAGLAGTAEATVSDAAAVVQLRPIGTVDRDPATRDRAAAAIRAGAAALGLPGCEVRWLPPTSPEGSQR